MFSIFIVFYALSLYLERKIIRKLKIDLWNKDNILMFFLIPLTFALALCTFILGVYFIINIIFIYEKKDLLEVIGYFFTFTLASLAYIINYIRKRIYVFISIKDKLSTYKIKIIYT